MNTPRRKRIEEMYSGFAQEPVNLVTWSGDVVAVTGSEIACLRIFSELQERGRRLQSGLWVGPVGNDGTWGFAASLRGELVTEFPAPGETRSDGLGVEVE